MKAMEALKIIALITTAYPNREWTDEQTELWISMLSGVEFLAAQTNLRSHILTSRFPPSVAEVANRIVEQSDDSPRLVAHTGDRFAEMESWERKSIDCPSKFQRLGDGL